MPSPRGEVSRVPLVGGNARSHIGQQYLLSGGKLGAGRVSFVSSQLPEDDLGTVQSLLAVGGHRVETITHVFADTLVAHEEGWHEARTRLSRLINTAREIGRGR